MRHDVRPPVAAVHYAGAAGATPAPGVLEAIAGAELIVLAPSSPMASLGPVLAVAGVRDALRAAPAPIVAVTPIVSSVPITDPGEHKRATSRAVLQRAAALEPTATAVAGLYADLCDRFVLDAADAAEAAAIRALGAEVVVAPTLVHRGASPDGLLQAVLAGLER